MGHESISGLFVMLLQVPLSLQNDQQLQGFTKVWKERTREVISVDWSQTRQKSRPKSNRQSGTADVYWPFLHITSNRPANEKTNIFGEMLDRGSHSEENNP